MLLAAAVCCQYPAYDFDDGHTAGGAGSAGASGGSDAGSAGSGGTVQAGKVGAGGEPSAAGAAGEPSSAGAGGAPSVAQLCADVGFVPSGCKCFDNDDHAYLFCITPTKSWEAAAFDCTFYEMKLARVNDPQENQWIIDEASTFMVPSYFQYFWIGGSSIGEAGNWRWADEVEFWSGLSDGNPMTGVYVNWVENAPNNGLSEFCLMMDIAGWDDTECAEERAYVCESY